MRKYSRFGNKKVLIGRVFGGLGLPYSNSTVLPFSKQYFSGGAFSLRSFNIHSLGPGTYEPEVDDNSSFFDQSGDIKLEANIEYRFPIYSYLEGAVFTDVGNVWLVSENDDLPGGKFTKDFYKELAMGSGIGLRLNIQSFAIRLDYSVPFRTPYLTENERTVLSFRRAVLNFAIGYPF